MNQVWTTDSAKIHESLRAVISEDVDVSLQLTNGTLTKSRAVKIHNHGGKLYILFLRTSDIQAVRQIQAVFFKPAGLPILGFHSTTIKASEKLLAFPLPDELFYVQRRKHPRFLTPQGSVISFLMDGRERANVCLLKDISKGGARLHGSPIYPVMTHDIIGPSTLTLSGYESLITREVTLQKAKIVRVRRGNKSKAEMGINFMLSTKEKQQLNNHLNYLTNDSPFPFPKTPFSL